jgi:hypothetical protein
MIPDLLRARPHLRDVFDRYGLRGCGGAHGPAETLAYFARAHGVELERLLSELRQADRTVPHPAAAHARGGVAPRPLPVHFADTIYRPFFKTAIAIALSAGAVWGAYLLIRIALAGSFTAISIHDINAHGHAQIFGWVGLFVMGFAYQAFPRMRHTTLWRRPGIIHFLPDARRHCGTHIGRASLCRSWHARVGARRSDERGDRDCPIRSSDHPHNSSKRPRPDLD